MASMKSPLVKRPVASNGQAAPLVGGGDQAEEELGAHRVEGSEAQLVNDEQVVAQQVLDEAADRVVGEAAVERLDEGGRHEVAHALAGGNGGRAQGQQQMRLSSARRTDQAQ